MNKNIFYGILILFLSMSVAAFGKVPITLSVRDSFTKNPIDSITVELYDLKGDRVSNYFLEKSTGIFLDQTVVFDPVIQAPDSGRYELRISAPHHSEKKVTVEIKPAQKEVDLGKIFIDKIIELQGLEVIRSKVKMVMNGDTIVYNADAFNVANGSMLDRLIEQLPGVKLSDDGRITVNGEFVHSLLINGKDFFNGNPSVALQNLPAYTVNKVKVYRREGQSAYLKDRTAAERKSDPLVIDVNLKKEFLGSYIMHADIAGGSSDRYSLRAFVAGFDKETNLGVFGNVNNVGETEDPARDRSISTTRAYGFPEKISRSAGLSLYNNGNDGRRIINFQASGRSNTTFNETQTTSFHTLTPDYTYSSRSTGHDRATAGSLSASGDIALRQSIFYSKTAASLQFDRNRSFSRSTSRSNSGDRIWEGIGLEDPGFINSYFRESGLRSTGHSLSFSEKFIVRMPYNGDNLDVNLEGSHAQSDATSLSVSNNTARGEGRSILNDFMKTPSRMNQLSAGLSYSHKFGSGLTLTPGYGFSRKEGRNERALSHYLPDSVMTALPVVTDTLTMIPDLLQSFTASNLTTRHTVMLNSSFGIGKVNFNLKIPYSWITDRLRDTRAPWITRRSNSLDINADLSWETLSLYYKKLTATPGAGQLLDFTDDSNLMVIRKGNPDLRNTKTHEIIARFLKFYFSRQAQLTFEASYSFTRDALANALSFDPGTGVSTITTHNVDGDRELWGRVSFSKSFGYLSRFSLFSYIQSLYARNIGFSSTGTPEYMRSIVNTLKGNLYASLSYSTERFSVNTSIRVNTLKNKGNLETFVRTEAVEVNPGVSGWVRLPLGFQIEANLRYEGRTGYQTAVMNRDQTFLGVAAQNNFGKRKEWTVKVEGFDLLGQISGLTQSVNPQGITETRQNLIGRYVLFHLQYRFDYVKTKR